MIATALLVGIVGPGSAAHHAARGGVLRSIRGTQTDDLAQLTCHLLPQKRQQRRVDGIGAFLLDPVAGAVDDQLLCSTRSTSATRLAPIRPPMTAFEQEDLDTSCCNFA